MDEESIFLAAIRHTSSAQRAAFLSDACGVDQQLKDRVEALLHSHDEAGTFLNEPAAPVATLDPPISEGPGTVIGPYKLLEQIGEGGMGVVFMAQQTEPIRRKVALKIIKPGMDTREVIARFEVERQVLALMDHPNIAKVLDAGHTGESSKSEIRNPKQIQNTKSESEKGDIGASDLEFVSDLARISHHP